MPLVATTAPPSVAFLLRENGFGLLLRERERGRPDRRNLAELGTDEEECEIARGVHGA
jgi:hypothetical protein